MRTVRFGFLLALLSLLAAAPARAELYKYIDAQGNEAYTNDLGVVPPDQRASVERHRLQKKLPSEAPEPPVSESPVKTLTPQDKPPSELSLPSIVKDLIARIPSEIARKLVRDHQSGLVLLPDSLQRLERDARPYLRMALVFLLVAGGLVLLVTVLRKTFRWDPDAINANPFLKMRGLLWGLSIFIGAGLAMGVWYGARLDWKHELGLLWESTGGAVIQGDSGGDKGALRIVLADEVVQVRGPEELMSLYRRVVRAYENALDAAESDVAYLEEICSGKKEPENLQDLTKRLLNMDAGLKLARRKEDDVGAVRFSAERRGLLLGEDPRERAQPRLAEMQSRIQQAQLACTQRSVQGLQQRREFLGSGGDL